MKTSERLYEAVETIWDACIHHPFVQGIADASLPVEKYRYYTMQDDLYIVQYTKPFGYGVIKASNEEETAAFGMKVPVMIESENEMHQAYLRTIGITQEMIEANPMNDVCRAYTDYMISISAREGLAEIVTAVLPCSWCYEKIGEFMEAHASEQAKKSPVFGPWISMYTDPGFRKMNDALIDMVDRYSKDYTEAQIQNLIEIMTISSRYELAFWEASWNHKNA
jgi:thiaminase/transcriptional activator TenA